ncbi:MAG: hypothetical protein ACI4I9_02395 [Porcipelethomonas sp.]
MSRAEQLFGRLRGIKGTKFIVFLGIAGIAAIFLSDILFSGEKENKNSTDEITDTGGYEAYVSETESRLCDMLEKIDGVGKADVMLTVSGTEEYIYAEEEKTNIDSERTAKEKKYVVIGGGSGKEALLRKIENPEISGVVIVCEGGDSNIVKEKVINAVSAAFDLSSKKIFVAKSK